MTKPEAINAELRALEEWDKRFPPSDVLDEIGIECRRLRVEELICTVTELVTKNRHYIPTFSARQRQRSTQWTNNPSKVSRLADNSTQRTADTPCRVKQSHGSVDCEG